MFVQLNKGSGRTKGFRSGEPGNSRPVLFPHYKQLSANTSDLNVMEMCVCVFMDSPSPMSGSCWRAPAAAPRRWKRRLGWPGGGGHSGRSAPSGTAARTRLWSGCRSAAPRYGPAARSSACLWSARTGRPGTPACCRVDGGPTARGKLSKAGWAGGRLAMQRLTSAS